MVTQESAVSQSERQEDIYKKGGSICIKWATQWRKQLYEDTHTHPRSGRVNHKQEKEGMCRCWTRVQHEQRISHEAVRACWWVTLKCSFSVSSTTQWQQLYIEGLAVTLSSKTLISIVSTIDIIYRRNVVL